MKKYFLLGLVLATTTIFTSCGKDGTSDIVINDNSVINTYGNGTLPTIGEAIDLKGNHNQDLTLDATKQYKISGPVIMATGTTLKIPAGMIIKADATGSDVYIAISQGAKIDAQGTAAKPIILTSASVTPAPGDWGGLILLGKAPITSATGTATATSEIGTLPYGGTDPADNSGIIKYMRIEYSGGAASGSAENNAFSFYGVGNGTTVDYIQAYEGKDDGVEFFGGTVEISHVSAVNNDDDSLDWTDGFSGKITNAYVKQGLIHDKGIEADGYNSDTGNLSNPIFFSHPIIKNVTIMGSGLTVIKDDGTVASTEAVRLRVGTQGIFFNILIKNYANAFKLVGDNGDNPTGTGVLSGKLHANRVKLDNVTTPVINNTGVTFTDAQFLNVDNTATGTDYDTWGAGWTRK